MVLLVLCLLAGLSHLISLWQLLVALRFPLHRRSGNVGYCPSVTVLKPLKGVDTLTASCLESWLNQDYAGPVQILFGVHDDRDPVCPVVESLLARFPGRAARLVVCPDRPGANAKVGTLIQLSDLTQDEVIIVSDADVKVSPDLISQIVQPLNQDWNVLSNCFYSHANPATVAQQWEALSTNADFWSQVLQSRTLKAQDFALGAAMAVRRSALEKIGGFRALANHLADDYQLGRRVHQQGGGIALCPVVVECWDGPADWREVWSHQLRWARTVRVCQPAPYAASIINNVTVWSLAAMIVGRHHPLILLAGSVILGLRMAFARGLAQRLGGWSPSGFQTLWLVPLRDLLGVVVWALAFFGSSITWRGIHYQVRTDGTLQPVEN